MKTDPKPAPVVPVVPATPKAPPPKTDSAGGPGPVDPNKQAK